MAKLVSLIKSIFRSCTPKFLRVWVKYRRALYLFFYIAPSSVPHEARTSFVFCSTIWGYMATAITGSCSVNLKTQPCRPFLLPSWWCLCQSTKYRDVYNVPCTWEGAVVSGQHCGCGNLQFPSTVTSLKNLVSISKGEKKKKPASQTHGKETWKLESKLRAAQRAL